MNKKRTVVESPRESLEKLRYEDLLRRYKDLKQVLDELDKYINEVDQLVRDLCRKIRDSRVNMIHDPDEIDEYEDMDLLAVIRNTKYIFDDYKTKRNCENYNVLWQNDVLCLHKEALQYIVRNLLMDAGLTEEEAEKRMIDMINTYVEEQSWLM